MNTRSIREKSLRISYALADQGVFSIAGFTFTLLLGRWFNAGEFGAFSVAYAVFLYIAGFHNALILEPMTVFGSAHRDTSLSAYLGAVLALHAILTISLAIVLVAASAAIPLNNSLFNALLGAAVATPTVLLFWTLRRSFYLKAGPSRAFRVTAIYAVALGILIYAATSVARLSPATAFILLASASLVACAAVWKRTGVSLSGLFTGLPSRQLRVSAHKHWHYGKWIVVSAALTLGSNYAQTFIAAGMLGLSEAGTIRALQTLTLPIYQVITALGLLTLPTLTRKALPGITTEFRNLGRFVTSALICVALAYEFGLLVFFSDLEDLAYREQYASSAWLIPILGLAPVFAAVTGGFSLMLRAAQLPKHFLVQSVVTAPIGILTTVTFAFVWGVSGVAASMVVTTAATALTTYILYRRWLPLGATCEIA